MALGVGALGVNLKRAFRTRSPPERRARHWDPNFPPFPCGARAPETLSSVAVLGALAGRACEFSRPSWE